MNKDYIIGRASQRAGVSRLTMDICVNAFLAEVVAMLADHNDVDLGDLGYFVSDNTPRFHPSSFLIESVQD